MEHVCCATIDAVRGTKQSGASMPLRSVCDDATTEDADEGDDLDDRGEEAATEREAGQKRARHMHTESVAHHIQSASHSLHLR
jgi:hypothetical protein